MQLRITVGTNDGQLRCQKLSWEEKEALGAPRCEANCRILFLTFHTYFGIFFVMSQSLQHRISSSMSSLMCGRIRGVVGQFLRAPRAAVNVTPSRPQLLYVTAFNVIHTNQRSFCTSLPCTHRSIRPEQSRTYRCFSSQAMILEDEDDDATDMNKEPLFVHVYPGSRVLEMALPYESMKMKQIDAMIRSTQPPVIQEKESKSLPSSSSSSQSPRSLSVEGCNVLSPTLVTSMQAQLEGLCSNASVRNYSITIFYCLQFIHPYLFNKTSGQLNGYHSSLPSFSPR